MIKRVCLIITLSSILASCKSNEKDKFDEDVVIKEYLNFSTDEEMMYIERIKILENLIAFKHKKQLSKGAVVELYLKGKTHTNKLYVTKANWEEIKNWNNYRDILKYEQFILDSVPVRDLGLLSDGLKLSKEMVRERKEEYNKTKLPEYNYFIDQAIHFISNCDKESKDYLWGVDAIFYANKDYSNYKRRWISKLFEFCHCEHELTNLEGV